MSGNKGGKCLSPIQMSTFHLTSPPQKGLKEQPFDKPSLYINNLLPFLFN